METITKKNKMSTYDLVLMALMTALVMVLTWIIRVPVVATEGYIHLGDTMVFFSVILLGWKRGAATAAVGSALADIIGGYAYYAPITFVVKGLMAIAMGLVIEAAVKKGAKGTALKIYEVFAMILGGFVMVFGYYLAEGFMYGNFTVPLAAIPMNIVQFVVGLVLASLLATSLYKTSFGSKFTYHLD